MTKPFFPQPDEDAQSENPAPKGRKKPAVQLNGHASHLAVIEGSAVERHTLRDTLAVGDKGNIFPTYSNLLLILMGDPLLAGIVRRNEFTYQIEITRAPPELSRGHKKAPGPYPRQIDENDRTRILAYLHKAWVREFHRNALQDCLSVQAGDQCYHPVRDYLDSLKWDGKARVDQWLTMTFGCDDDEYNRSVGSKLLIAAVRRVRQPGCKFDHLVILEGPEGIYKSTAVAVLFGQQWTTDDMPHDLAHKDAAIALIGRWCIEMAEIVQLLRSGNDTSKAFLSRAIDRYRPHYGKDNVDFPRQCVMVGTTNETEYLRSTTGNRRIWPVKCMTAEGASADIDWLRDNRDQIWAEASVREAKGEMAWIESVSVKHRALQEQSARLSTDPWTDRVLDWARQYGCVRVPWVLQQAVFVQPQHQDKKSEMRVAGILRSNGWIKDKPSYDNALDKTIRQWLNPDRDVTNNYDPSQSP